jgi:excisionase family DNA binding protein
MRRDELVGKWSRKADEFDALAATVDAAAMCQQFIGDLQSLGADGESDWVSITEAATLSGYSKQHIRRLIQSGQLAAQREGKERQVRLHDLPRKPVPVAKAMAELHLLGATAEQAVRESVGAS